MPKRAGRTPLPRGEAGRKGEDIRSDLHVTVELRDSGGLQFEVISKVASFYGESINATAETVLRAMNVEHASVQIDDKGALPFVVAARVEAAARRVGSSGTAPPDRTVTAKPTPRHRMRRSRLYLPGNEPKFFINAGLHEPDAIILDLEDSVHPEQKDTARILVRNALRCVDFRDAERMVRMNQLPLGLEDLQEVVPEAPNLILIPKVEHPDQVREVQDRIARLQPAGDHFTIWLMPIVESALGIENAFAIASAADTVAAITIGLEDYTADIGVPKTAEGMESHYARTRLVNAAHAARIQAIDSVFGDVGDETGLRAWAARSRSLGFEGMGCIHPRHIQPIHESFAPSPAEIDKALKIVAAFEAAQARGVAVVSLGTRMVDPPVVLRAQRVVEQAKQAGVLNDSSEETGGGNR